MLHHIRLLAFWLALVAMGWWLWPQSALRHPPGVRVKAEPVQQLFAARPLCQIRSYDLMAVASFAVEARVLHTKRYWADADDLVPYDVAIGWGAMSDQAVLDRLKISQSNRFFFYQWWNEPPLPQAEITSHATNLHLIAANAAVASAVRHLRAGQFVRLQGYLVNVTRPNGFRWNTSLRRDDTGRGACELFYVEAISARNEPG